tara:strand:- start:75270 stop:76013 length:744 start_codon:yes stop_codon:yes gene_type:complete
MTIKEFSNEFDIYYNSIATNSAPGLDIYEKSVYLTKAQLEIIKNYFIPRGNKYQVGFEGSSKRRVDLTELVRNHKTTLQITSIDGIDDNSKFFKIPNNTYLIIQEKAKVISYNECVNNNYIKVVPKTHDEYNIQEKNPFKKPDKSVIWRMDYFSQNGSNKNVELISPYSISEYKFRYVMYPSPIILGDLLSLFPGETLSIDGVSQPQTCKLDIGIHREILDRAVELALADYKPEKLQLKTQMSLRNE